MYLLDEIFFFEAETKREGPENVLRCFPAFAVKISGKVAKARKDVLGEPLVGLVCVSIASHIIGFLVEC